MDDRQNIDRADGYDDRYMNDDADRYRPDATPRVAALDDLGDFQVADGYPDPRGWDVVLADGTKVGEVHDLIVDTGEMRTRYLDLSLDKDALGTDDDHDVLLPVGAAQLDENDDRVLLGSLSTAQLAALPRFDHGEISRQYEDSVLARMPAAGAAGLTGATAGTAAGATAGYYNNPHFDDRRFFGARGQDRATRSTRDLDRDTAPTGNAGRAMDRERLVRSEEELVVGKRPVQAGEVDIHKRVETEHVTKPVTLRREEVTIERRPISGDRAAGQAGAARIGSDDEIRIPLTAEEAVVEKRPVVKEEVVVKKQAVQENKTVEADLRKERIDVDRNTDRDIDRTRGA